MSKYTPSQTSRGESRRTVRRIACVAPPSPVEYVPALERSLQDDQSTRVVDVVRPHLEAVPSLSSFDLVVLAGSAAHVSERSDWMSELGERVERALAAGTPTFGICFGYQFLADLLGGTVSPLPEPETGFREIRTTDAGRRTPLFDGLGDRFVSFTWHWDHVSRPPPGTTVLAENDAGIHAFAASDVPAAGVQFHPECGRSLAREHLDSVTEEVRQSTASSTTLATTARPSERLYQNLIRVVSSPKSTLSPAQNL